jgi:hypothetical protein
MGHSGSGGKVREELGAPALIPHVVVIRVILWVSFQNLFLIDR